MSEWWYGLGRCACGWLRRGWCKRTSSGKATPCPRRVDPSVGWWWRDRSRPLPDIVEICWKRRGVVHFFVFGVGKRSCKVTTYLDVQSEQEPAVFFLQQKTAG